MPHYFFRVRNGQYFGHPVQAELADNDSAWDQAARIWADLARDIMVRLKTNPDWLMEVTDETEKVLFRFRFTAEKLK